MLHLLRSTSHCCMALVSPVVLISPLSSVRMEDGENHRPTFSVNSSAANREPQNQGNGVRVCGGRKDESQVNSNRKGAILLTGGHKSLGRNNAARLLTQSALGKHASNGGQSWPEYGDPFLRARRKEELSVQHTQHRPVSVCHRLPTMIRTTTYSSLSDQTDLVFLEALQAITTSW